MSNVFKYFAKIVCVLWLELGPLLSQRSRGNNIIKPEENWGEEKRKKGGVQKKKC